MAKRFSVEWLSQSSQGSATHLERTDFTEMPGTGASKLPNSPSNSFGYASGSESEVGEDSEGEVGPHRRVRTKFTSEQIFRLERTFNKHRYLGATQRRQIAEKLHLSETQVKTWFQNRRMKLKREVQDMRTEYLAPALLSSALLPPPAAFQHHAFPGQRPHFPLYPHPARVLHPAMLASCYY
ncbi:ventral expressed homeobox [Denticeps clupeoides]|uniref:Homeobox domain-containing protein n=1 Tax=Denticeps clupeoides TaxID=299321 RepID=A0AAY4ENC0_9TELE|nr:homeobox protein vent1-like [Denticeps clupeoides]